MKYKHILIVMSLFLFFGITTLSALDCPPDYLQKVLIETEPCPSPNGPLCTYYIHYCFKCEISYDGIGPDIVGSTVLTLDSYEVVPESPYCESCTTDVSNYIITKLHQSDWWQFFGDSLCNPLYEGVPPCPSFPKHVYIIYPSCWHATLELDGNYTYSSCIGSPLCLVDWTVCFNSLTQSYDWQFVSESIYSYGTMRCPLEFNSMNYPLIYPTIPNTSGNCFHYPYTCYW